MKLRIRVWALVLPLVLTGVASADENSVAAALEKAGAIVTRDDKQPGKPVVSVRFFTNATDASLKDLKEFGNLRVLGISHSAVTDAGVKELKELKALQALDLNAT